MARSVDLRGKLGMAEHPTIITDFGTLKINDSAKSILQMLSIINAEDGATAEDTMEAARLLFDAKSYAKVEKSDLTPDGLMTLIRAAAELAMGGAGEGEAPTPAMT